MELHGTPRLIAMVLIAASVVFIGISYWHYGLRAQSVHQVSHMIPLLFAGLMLGRRAVWLTAVAMFCTLIVGLVADVRLDPQPSWMAAATPLVQPALASLIIALILDRLIAKSVHADQRSRDLDLVCEELEIEIREKEQKQAQLIHSQKMDALGQLAGGIAHDFNNLLSVILGYLTDPMNQLSARHALENLESAEQAARRGSEVTRRLLSLSRNSGPAIRFDAGLALNEVAPLVRSLFQGKSKVLLDIPAEPFPIRMDRQEFELAILNVAGNARDAMPGGGEFRLSVMRQEGRVAITLSDTGHGMPPAVRERIFEPFFTTKAEGIGTGIGLSVVYQTITEAGGTIGVQSSDATGTTIRIELPEATPRGRRGLPPAG